MLTQIPQPILDALTDVAMPKLPEPPLPGAVLELDGHRVPVVEAACAVIGSGAAGLRAAVEAQRRGVDVVILSQSAWGGTSACSGSDKQTLHTANTADRGDDFRDMAGAIGAGGAMDQDTAYIEAVGSVRAMASLQYLGLPLPQDPLGGTLRYQTDHDEVGRATSCGPRTSRLMVRVLADEALRLGIPFYNLTTAVRIVRDEGGAICGVLAMRNRDRGEKNPLGLIYFRAPTLVLAAGGPGELYRDSVFPNGCFGSLGLALEAGVALVNLTESQFGIGTRREGFPWNLSGTYVQAMPHIYSVDAEGQEYHFLADYYRTTQELASNIFRKGYQWPFHASRMLNFGSSLVDLAIVRESAQGRRVYMDFNRNPLMVPGDKPFSLDRLDDDVAHYLGTAGASQDLPIDRLRHMNPLAIELYRRYKIDVATEPLEFAVNNQHMNGGIAVDIWGQSSVPGIYAVGEAAGTHGVTRPGGSALNAGQVFGTRAAEHLAKRSHTSQRVDRNAVGREVAALAGLFRERSAHSVEALQATIQARMSDNAGPFCVPEDVEAARRAASDLNAAIAVEGLALPRPNQLSRALQWRHMALASEAVLTALDHYIANGGGSRGARAICDPQGTAVPETRTGTVEAMRFREERSADTAEQITVHLTPTGFEIGIRPNRRRDEAPTFFERDWPAWLTGRIYDGVVT
ncbi:FAD-dependent oxidoreductase [Pontivivens insulae]|uniref:Succinate dehydrogenase flavoprotein subunit n=1 Tax=Pontivivens insulae TaxID=1639689 RepID=A0A2R8AEM9_9RHOB|nr:FAD-binding protein [Pontivivens insulae]RED14422.1 succinate dehydrogenase/fumarate reductase flavoprotein subunit [Pontivivens insulae]SPF30500.1 Succinate dehydrogenase flavoprotein subunit [Pontivivens insulae]